MDPLDPNSYVKLPIQVPPRNQALKSTTFRLPPLDGSLTLSQIYDWHLEHSSKHAVFIYADQAGNEETIEMAEVVYAIHRAARRIQSTIQERAHNSTKRPVVSILASSDSITFFAVILGVMRAGYTVFPISIRNSVPAIVHLLTKSGTDHLIIGPEATYQGLASAAIEALKKDGARVPHTSTMPVFEDLYGDWLPRDLLPDYKAEMTDVALYLHSSGSTAYPKLIPMTYYRQIIQGICPFFGERDWTGMKMSVHSTPMYHLMGVMNTILVASVGVTLTVFAPQSPAQIPTPDNLLRAAVDTRSDLALCVPSFIEIWARDPKQLQELKKIQGVVYGGGPLQKEAGDALHAQGVEVYTVYGCTETGGVNAFLPMSTPKDWEYFYIPSVVKTHFIPDGNGNAELVVMASEYSRCAILNTTVDGVGAYATQDILAPHPTKPGWWKVYGRADDQIMHSTGEKTNPGPLEKILKEDPRVQSSIIFGRGRFNTGVLVDPKPEYEFDPADQKKLAAFRNAIWPTVERMNQFAPQHSRIYKEMIIVASPEKPLEYTVKNEPRRQAMINLYEAEIDALYDAIDESAQAELAPPPTWNYASSKSFVRAVVTKVLDHHVDDEDDLFLNGCDSLQATWIRNAIMRALRETTEINTRAIDNNFVYRNPTVAGLAALVSALTNSESPGDDLHDDERRVAAMLAMVDKYASNFPTHVPGRVSPKEEVVLVTGTTGSLGASLLVALVQSPNVARVYALNRKGSLSVHERQKAVLDERRFDAEAILGSSKVVLLESKADEVDLGLPFEIYEELQNSLTLIIHNAWPVNFNLGLSSFEPNIKTVRNLVDLALSSPYASPAKLLFISSVSTLRGLDSSHRIEEAPVDATAAIGAGYSESKWVVERILALASSKTPLRAVAIRSGQISGSTTGAWNKSEWLPSLVKSSVFLGCLPSLDQSISWIPVDVAALAVFEMRDSPVGHLHLAHPRPVSWSTIMEPLARKLGLPMVPYHDWLASLVKSGEGLNADDEVETMRRNPALKIVGFFREIGGAQEVRGSQGADITLDMSEAERIAPSLSAENLPQLDGEDVDRWLAYWKGIGFL